MKTYEEALVEAVAIYRGKIFNDCRDIFKCSAYLMMAAIYEKSTDEVYSDMTRLVEKQLADEKKEKKAKARAENIARQEANLLRKRGYV